MVKGNRYILLDKWKLERNPNLKNVIFVFDYSSYVIFGNQYWFTYYIDGQKMKGWFGEETAKLLTNYDDLLINFENLIKTLA